MDLDGLRFRLEKHMKSDPRRVGSVPVTIWMPAGLTPDQRRKLENAGPDLPGPQEPAARARAGGGGSSIRTDGRGRRLPYPFASYQLRPQPASTTSGTLSSATPSISCLTSGGHGLGLRLGDLEDQLVVDGQEEARVGVLVAQAAVDAIIAFFRRSAAVPWMRALIAMRRAFSRSARFLLWMSGRQRTRP